jgi:broad specificity phosphatase PhoE
MNTNNKKVYFIRHAEGYHNVNESYHIFNPELTPLGKQQVEQKRHIFKNIIFDDIFVSPLKRTIQTATGLFCSESNNVRMSALEEIREVVYNPCDLRQNISVTAIQYPHVSFSIVKYNIDIFNNENIKHESDESIKKRCIYVDNMLRNYNGKHVALVSHGGFIEKFMEYIHNKKNIFLSNCEYLILDY